MTPHANPAIQAIRQQIVSLLEVSNLDELRSLLKAQHPADIADILENLDDDQRVPIFNLLQDDIAAEVLDETSTEVTRELVDAVPHEKIADLLETMPMDDAAEVLSELADENAEDLLSLMEPAEAAEVEALLAYPEDTAGRLMSTKVVRLNSSWTVDFTLIYLRTIDPETETLAYLYVVDEQERLVGVVPLRNLITAPVTRTLSDIMVASPISVRADTDQEQVARLVQQYDFFAIPVVDTDGKLTGIITHDDVVDILQDEFTEDVQRLGGSEPLEEPYLSTPVFTVVRKRIGWLLILFFTEMLTGTVMRVFEGEIQAVVALSFFVPLMIGTGGNSGSQQPVPLFGRLPWGSVVLRIRFACCGTRHARCLLGVVMGLVGFIRAVTWGTERSLALTGCYLVVRAGCVGQYDGSHSRRWLPGCASIRRHLRPVMSTWSMRQGSIYFTLAQVIIGP
jgi:magnesium transporter